VAGCDVAAALMFLASFSSFLKEVPCERRLESFSVQLALRKKEAG